MYIQICSMLQGMVLPKGKADPGRNSKGSCVLCRLGACVDVRSMLRGMVSSALIFKAKLILVGIGRALASCAL